MSTKTLSKPIFQGKNDQGKNSSMMLGLSLVVVFLLVAITFVLGTRSLQKIGSGIEVEQSFAVNPELMVAQRYAASSAKFLAANPEINLARSYASTPLESSAWITNPEVFYARQYSEVRLEAARSAYLSANPELMITRSHILDRETGKGFISAAYPRLSYVRQYSETRLHSVKSDPYSTNPELKIVHRYQEARIQK